MNQVVFLINTIAYEEDYLIFGTTNSLAVVGIGGWKQCRLEKIVVVSYLRNQMFMPKYK